MNLETPNLWLVPRSLDETRARIDALPPAAQAELSADWLALLHAATWANPWIVGFTIIRSSDETEVGECGFKRPPAPDGVVELAYAIAPEYQGRGYATESAKALVSYALAEAGARIVRAHTLPTSNASTRVLIKSGFRFVGGVVDPDDGPVWRWETSE